MNIEGSAFLVTGGASLIGSHVVEALLEAGAARVRVLDSLAGDTAATLARLGSPDRLEFRRGDVLRTSDVLDALEGIDGVFHGAALITQPMAAQPETGVDVNVHGTAVLLAGAAHARVDKVVLMSSVSVYGNTTGAKIREEAPFVTAGLGWPSQLYGGGKLLAEGLCRAYANKHGFDWVALRAPSVYGPFQHARGMSATTLVRLWRLLRDQEQPTLPVDPDEAHDYIYVTDVAGAALAAFRAPATGTALNVSSGESVSYRQVVELLGEIGAARPARFAPETGGVRLTTSSELSYDRGLAEQLLAWRPQTPLREGLRALTGWVDRQDTEQERKAHALP